MRRHEHARLDRELRQRQGEEVGAALVEPGLGHDARRRRLGRAQRAPRAAVGGGPASSRRARGASAAMWSAVTPQQPPMICAPSSRQPSASSAYASGPIVSSKRQRLPAQMAEVRVDAERQLGEVAQPRDDARHVVDRQAVDQQRLDAHLLEAPRGAAEEVALGRAPVLAVDPAHAVAAAADTRARPAARSRAAARPSRTSPGRGSASASRAAACPAGRPRTCARAARCVSRRRGELTSSEIANATAQSLARPASTVALRASWMPRRATSIQWPGSPLDSRARCSASGAERIDQVAVESTLQPAAR